MPPHSRCPYCNTRSVLNTEYHYWSLGYDYYQNCDACDLQLGMVCGWWDEVNIFIERANKFAIIKHLNQKDDDGRDYYSAHLEPVQKAVSMLITDYMAIAASVLHDTLEDTDTTYDELVWNFGERVADLVNEVTKEGKNFPRLKSPEAIVIKFVDRASNLSRMKSWDKKHREQYLRKSKFWKDGSDR